MLPQPTPIERKLVSTAFGILFLLFYSFQNFIPGIGALPRALAYVLVALVLLGSAASLWPELKRDVPSFFRHFRRYFGFFFPKFVLFMVIYFVTAVLIAAAAGEASANQTALSAVPLPLLALSALIYAPVQEELLYRGVLRRLFADKRMFIVVSALFFGLIHMLHPGQTPGQMLYIVEYALLGGFLAYLYAESDNICLSVMGHFCLNLVAFLPML